MAKVVSDPQIYSVEDIALAIQKASSTLGYHLKVEQYKAVSSVLNGNNIVVALPTEFGKSLIFGILPLAFDELKSMLLPILMLYIPHYKWLICFRKEWKYCFVYQPPYVINDGPESKSFLCCDFQWSLLVKLRMILVLCKRLFQAKYN